MGRGQRGQAIVLVGLIMVVLFGFVGLAMDGGRGYLDRRSLQASVDAASLAAAYNYMNTSNTGLAEQAASAVYASNQRLYVPPSCSGIGTLNAVCTFSDPTNQVLTIAVVDHSIAGVTFTATATHQVGVTVMQVVGVGSTMNIGATATAVARKTGTAGAAIQTLSPGGCNGATNSLVFTGTSLTQVTGDIWSNGSIVDNGTAGGSDNGNVVDICPNMPPLPLSSPLWSVTGTEGNGFNLPDPDYPLPPLNNTPQTWNSANESTQLPGTYSSDPNLTGQNYCWFLSGGVYDFSGGFKQNTGFVSNELRPPDEPVTVSPGVADTTTLSADFTGSNQTQIAVNALPGAVPAGAGVYINGQSFTTSANAAAGALVLPINKQSVSGTLSNGSRVTLRSPNQFWDANGATSCSSAFTLSSPGSGSFAGGTYSVEVTAVRWAPNGVASCSGPSSPTCYERESAPSMCKTVSLATSGNLKVTVTTDPGAQDFNIYLASGAGCSGFTLCGDTAGGGVVNGISSCTAGVAPPDGEGLPLAAGLPNADPLPGAPPHGDLANEQHCVDPATGNNVSCPSGWTPGAVVLFIPGPGSNQQCLNLQGGGDIYTYSGYQYNRVLVYEPGPEQTPPPNTCPNNVAGHGLTSLIGIFYVPAASVTIIGNSSYLATIAGGVIAWTASVKGNGGVSISADPTLRKWPPAVRLVQ